MKTQAMIGNWMSKGRWRVHVLFVLLMLLPIAIFAYSVGRVLRHQAEAHAVTESAQIAHVSAALVEEHFRQTTAFLESIASRPTFREALTKEDRGMLERGLKEAHALRPDFAFVSCLRPARYDAWPFIPFSQTYSVKTLPSATGTRAWLVNGIHMSRRYTKPLSRRINW